MLPLLSVRYALLIVSLSWENQPWVTLQYLLPSKALTLFLQCYLVCEEAGPEGVGCWGEPLSPSVGQNPSTFILGATQPQLGLAAPHTGCGEFSRTRFIFPNETLHPLNTNLPPPPQPPRNYILPASANVTDLMSANHTAFVLFCLAYFTQQNLFKSIKFINVLLPLWLESVHF